MGIAAAPDGSALYVGGQYTVGIKRIDLTTSAVTDLIDATEFKCLGRGNSDDIIQIAVTSAGDKLYVGCVANRKVYEIDVVAQTMTEKLTTPGKPVGIAVSSDGATVYVQDSRCNGFQIATSSSPWSANLKNLGGSDCAACSSMTMGANGCAPSTNPSLPESARGIVLDDAGTYLYAGMYDAGSLQRVNLMDGTSTILPLTPTPSGYIYGIAMHGTKL